ncbi:MAG: potassium/proton antiporter [Gemmatimonas sp.]
MELAHHLILIGAGLVVLSIFAGLVSSRVGAPLLLVFLGLGMLAGEDGPGGLHFGDFDTAYLAGSLALAVILFDGGLRTTRQNLTLAFTPALVLATVGVVVTAGITGAAATWLLGLHWAQGLLIGAIVGSTDAAAVFFILHLRGLHVRERLSATLEVESGFNDPMAIFLTMLGVNLLQAGMMTLSWETAGHVIGLFLRQMIGGGLLGFVGGTVLLRLINRLDIASGLYPVLALAGAMLIFAVAQTFDASGFLAIYLVGFMLGSRRHRATELINRFSDGFSWLAQILMFLMLGLLVTPTELLPALAPSVGVALVLMFIARPIAVWLCLKPFAFDSREIAFVAWVGLRGAVPIFLATIPVLAGVEGSRVFFSVAFVVVLISMTVQGWSVAGLARYLGLELPPHPAPPVHAELDLPGTGERTMTAYTVAPFSMATRRRLDRMRLPNGISIVTVIRDGAMTAPDQIRRLAPNDYVLILAKAEQIPMLDRLFAAGLQRTARSHPEEMLGEFVLDGSGNLGAVAELYEFPVPPGLRRLTVGRFLRLGLRRQPRPGDRLRVGSVDLIVRAVDEGRILKVGLDPDPPPSGARSQIDGARIWMLAGVEALRQLLPPRFRLQ